MDSTAWIALVSRSLRDTAYKAIYAKEGFVKKYSKAPPHHPIRYSSSTLQVSDMTRPSSEPEKAIFIFIIELFSHIVYVLLCTLFSMIPGS